MIKRVNRQTERNETVKDHLDEVTDAMKWIEAQSFDKSLVHIMDREADSIGPIRQWEAAKMNWLTRSRTTSGIEYQGESMACASIVEHLGSVDI